MNVSKFLALALAAFAATVSSTLANAQEYGAPRPKIAARSFALLDYQSKQFIASKKSDERIDPASLTKLMTAYLVFSALKQNRITLTQSIPVSERAWKAEGSRMFIEPSKSVTVDELLHGMIIQSANDASIALAEAIAGSEDLFTHLMNKEANRLGMKNTHFMNATGRPDKEHYTTAQDVVTLAAAIIGDFPEFFPLYSQRDYTYNKITQSSRNRLLWTDKFVDGMQTGYTEDADYCLLATAKRGNRRLIAAVLGTSSDDARAAESQKLLNYGFQFFDTQRLYAKNRAIALLDLFKGDKDKLSAGFQHDLYLTLPRNQFGKLKAILSTTRPQLAPINAGQKVGSVKLMVNNVTVAEYPVVALENVPLAGFLNRVWDSLTLLWKE